MKLLFVILLTVVATVSADAGEFELMGFRLGMSKWEVDSAATANAVSVLAGTDETRSYSINDSIASAEGWLPDMEFALLSLDGGRLISISADSPSFEVTDIGFADLDTWLSQGRTSLDAKFGVPFFTQDLSIAKIKSSQSDEYVSVAKYESTDAYVGLFVHQVKTGLVGMIMAFEK